MMKAYLIDAWEAGMEEVGRVFESINLAILIATDAGDVPPPGHTMSRPMRVSTLVAGAVKL